MNPTPEHARRRRRFCYVLVVLIECGLTLGAVELGLALFHPVPHSIAANMYFEADVYTGYRLKPGGIGHYQMGIPAVANSRGHRDVEVTLKKPLGVFSDSLLLRGRRQAGESLARPVGGSNPHDAQGSGWSVVTASLGVIERQSIWSTRV